MRRCSSAGGVSLLSLVIISLALASAVHASVGISPDEALRAANASKVMWQLGGVSVKKDKLHVQILLEEREVAKLKFPPVFAERNASQLVAGTTFGTPVLKQKKEGLVYEIPILYDSFEVGRIKVNATNGQVILKKEKREGKKLKGGSPAGHAMGIVGTLLIAASQVYTLRRQKLLTLGSLRKWQRVHYYLGFIGAVLVLLHAGFPYDFKFSDLKKGSLGVLTTYLMLVVFASGLAGRFLKGRRLRRWQWAHTQLVGTMFIFILLHVVLSLGED